MPFFSYDDNTWNGLERDNAGLYETALVRQWIPSMPAVQSLLEQGVDVADIGCGRGHVIRLLAQAFPASRFVGYDVFAPSVAYANARAAELGLSPRVRFEQLDAIVQPVASADLITTFQMVHDVPDPLRMLRAIRASLRPGGHYVCLDARVSERIEERTEPIDLVRYGFSLTYCLPGLPGDFLASVNTGSFQHARACAREKVATCPPSNARHVRDLAGRPSRRGLNVVTFGSGVALHGANFPQRPPWTRSP